MTDILAGSVISGLASGFGSLLGFGSQKSANQTNMELAKYQYDRALEMWNLQNEYNTPSEQRKRLQEAGLNPNLVYGHGQVQGLTSAPAPQYQTPHIGAYTNFGSLGVEQALTTYMGLKKMAADLDNTEAQTANTEAQTANVIENRKLIPQQYELNVLDIISKRIQNAKNDIDLEYWRKQWDNTCDLLAAQTDNYDSQTDLNEAKVYTEKAQPSLVLAKTRNTDVDTLLKGAQTVTERTKQVLNASQTNLNNQQSQLTNAKYVGQAWDNAYVADTFNERIAQCKLQTHISAAQKHKLIYEIQHLRLGLNSTQLNNEIDRILVQTGISLKDNSEVGTLIRLVYGLFNVFTGFKISDGG